MKESEVRVQYLNLAVGILSKPPTQSQEGMRTWAIQIMDKFSPIPLSEQQKKELRDKALEIESFQLMGSSAESMGNYAVRGA